jgi:hypothetical protein
MAIEFYDDRVQITHKLNIKESDDVNNYLQKNPDKYLRILWFENSKDLDFMPKIPSAKKIEISASTLDNIDFLSSLEDIEMLDINENQGSLNLDAIKNLKKLKILNLTLNNATTQTDLSILDDELTLEEFYFSGKFKKNSLNPNVLKKIKIFAPQLNTINFQDLNDLNQLKEIRLCNQKITSLEGIEKFPSVEKVTISGLKMENQDILSPIFDLPQLKELNLFYLKFIEDFTFIKKNHDLEFLNLVTLNGLKNYNGIEKLKAIIKLSHFGAHKHPNSINFENISSLKSLKELDIKIGQVNKSTKNEIERLIYNISS